MITQPTVMVKPFGEDAGPDFITFPIPTASQIPITPGAASLTDGFPPLNMADPESQGGILPAGQDFNGILYWLAWYCVWQQAGGGFYYSEAFATENGGYTKGAVLRSTTNDALQWLNTVNENMTDPDDPDYASGWIALTSGGEYLSVAVPAGTSHDFMPSGLTPAVSYLDLDTTAGNATITGIDGGFNGRKLIVSNTGANLLNLSATGSSQPENQFRLPTEPFSIIQNQSVTLEYVGALEKWLVV